MINEAKQELYKDASDWYQRLVKYIIVDPEIGKKQLEEKIKLMQLIRDKLQAELKHPQGWEQYQLVLNAIIPMVNIYQYFAMNGNQTVLQWILTSPFPVPTPSDMNNEHKYKTILSSMLNHTNSGISLLNRKKSLFDENKAKQNPLMANQQVLLKIDKHLG